MKKVEIVLSVAILSIMQSANVSAISLEPNVVQETNEEVDEEIWEETTWDSEISLEDSEETVIVEDEEEILPEKIKDNDTSEVDEEVLPKTGINDTLTKIKNALGDLFYHAIKKLIGR